VPDPGLSERSSWEGRRGALGRCAEDRGRRDGDSSDAGFGSVAVVGRGDPDRVGPAWAALRAGQSWEMETNPFPPCCERARGNQKAAENPGFPFPFGRGMGKHRGGDRQASGRSSTSSHCPGLGAEGGLALPIHPQLLRDPRLLNVPTAPALSGKELCRRQ